MELRAAQVPDFVRELGSEFDVDEVSLVEAIQSGGMWNICHLPSGLKVDLMMRKDTPYDRTAFARRRRFRIDVDIDPDVKSVEDSVVKQLPWFNAGGARSSPQWRAVPVRKRAGRQGWAAGQPGMHPPVPRRSVLPTRPAWTSAASVGPGP